MASNLLFSTFNSLLFLDLGLVNPRMQLAENIWNSMSTTDSKMLRFFQVTFLGQYQYLFLIYDHVNFEDDLQFQNLHYLHNRLICFDAIVFSAFSYSKFCPSVSHAAVFADFLCSSRNSFLFTVNYKTLPQVPVFMLLFLCPNAAVVWKMSLL